MKDAEINFFNTLSGGLEKDAQLSDTAIKALKINQPELLDQLEEQAKTKLSPAPQEPVAEEPSQETVEVAQGQEREPEEAPPPKLDISVQIPKNFFRIDNMHPLKILAILKLKYNDTWVHWLPETLWDTIRKDFGSVSEINQNKIQALAVSLGTTIPWNDWHIFENVGRAFNDTIPIFGQLQPLSPAETAFTIFVLKKLHPVFKFNDEVRGYIASVCLYNGILFAPPKWFADAQKLVDKQNQDLEAKELIRNSWKAIEKEDLTSVEFDDTKTVDVQVAKLWSIQEYLRERNSQLKE